MRSTSDTPNTIRLGVVAEVDAARGVCRVESGEILTDWLPFLTGAAGPARRWSVPGEGEQVALLCPDGQTEAAVVLRGLYSNNIPQPETSADVESVTYADGAVVRYDAAAHHLEAVLPGGGTATLTASGGLTVNGPVRINGNVQIDGDTDITGQATAAVDVVGGGKSLKNHRHIGVTAGTAVSGPPQ